MTLARVLGPDMDFTGWVVARLLASFEHTQVVLPAFLAGAVLTAVEVTVAASDTWVLAGMIPMGIGIAGMWLNDKRGPLSRAVA